ncbi:hypothetical protein D9M68_799740 [compost metagenome]
MGDVLAHGGKDRPGFFQGGGFATDHEGQGTGRGAGGTAGNRCIEQFDAVFGGGFMHLARRLRGDGRALQYQGAALERSQQTAIAQVQAFDMTAGRQHANHHLGALHGIGGAAGGLRAFLGQFLDCGRYQVEDLEAEAGFEQVAGHGQSHVAETDKGNAGHCVSLVRIVCLPEVRR